MLKAGRSGQLWKKWDAKAQKSGVHKTVYFVNGDEYTGDWKYNKRAGKLVSCPARLVRLSLCLSVFLSVCLFVCLSFCLSVCPACLSVLPACLPACLPVCSLSVLGFCSLWMSLLLFVRIHEICLSVCQIQILRHKTHKESYNVKLGHRLK